MTRFLAVAAIAAAAALGLAACGGDSSGGGAYGSGSETTTARAPAKPGGGAAVVSVGRVPELGTLIVDDSGRTLYDFHKDSGTTSACYGACAAAWPPLLTDGSPKAEKGASASKLGTTRRNDGTLQVTYAGHPLYTYVADTEPGQANGNDIDQFGAEWYALTPHGGEPKD
jgi:predicted lipoprotein with Yx(FWY)xxD motif